MQKIKEILTMQKRELRDFLEKKYVNRDVKLRNIEKDIIKVITGPRRAGKSFFIIHKLKKKFGYVNFDDENLLEVKDYNDIIAAVNSVYNNPKILFLDEIQNLPKWELFVNRIQRQGYNLIITGSNSKLLSKELATHLTGRYLDTTILPFSFKEYLGSKELTQSEIQAKLLDYNKWGGFPEPLIKELDYKPYLNTLVDSIMFKDIIKRHNIKNPKALESLSNFIFSNFANPISYKSLTRLTGIKSVHTIDKYLRYLEESFLFFKVNMFSFKVKEQIKSNKKIYVIDNGIINSKSFQFSKNMGNLYENIVAIELKKKELKKELEFYYYKNIQNYEVDFVLKKEQKIEQLIQVCHNIEDIRTKKREIRSLLHASKNLGCKNLLVITEKYDGEEVVNWFGIKGKIVFRPLWRWLLDQNLE